MMNEGSLSAETEDESWRSLTAVENLLQKSDRWDGIIHRPSDESC